jgi:hypothetical protein
MAILFADIVGYSRLDEDQVLTYHDFLLQAFAALLDSLAATRGVQRPAVQNTWGDAIYLVFSRVPDAGAVALLLSDLVLRVPWHLLGLPSNLSVRISLHAAPVNAVNDPIARARVRGRGRRKGERRASPSYQILQNYTGVHTSRAARIEPITPPGRCAHESAVCMAACSPAFPFCCSVYCSQSFAAIAETLCVPAFATSYVGSIPLAKGYGMQPLYHVRWGSTAEVRRLQSALGPAVASVFPAGAAALAEASSSDCGASEKKGEELEELQGDPSSRVQKLI